MTHKNYSLRKRELLRRKINKNLSKELRECQIHMMTDLGPVLLVKNYILFIFTYIFIVKISIKI